MKTNLKIPGSYPAWENLKEEEETIVWPHNIQEMLKNETGIDQVCM
jgi:hypothetical protein